MLVLCFGIFISFRSAAGQFQNCSQGGPPIVVQASRGTVASPKYPNNYPSDLNCEWLITLPESEGELEARFSRLSLQLCANCICDFLTVYNGSSKEAPVLGTFCGSQSSLPRYRASQLLLEFRTDEFYTSNGFRLVFEDADNGCNGQTKNLTTPGELRTPFYGYFSYDRYMSCRWRLQAQNNQIVWGFVERLSVYGGYDPLYIYDGPDETSPEITILRSAEEGYQFASTQPFMFLRFNPRHYNSADGFKLHYDFVNPDQASQHPGLQNDLQSQMKLRQLS